jgi:signal transduction histidine kinase
VRLSDLPRTTSFRLSLLFLALFGVASLLLFGFLYWQTTSYLTNSVDEWLGRETNGYVALAPDELPKRLQAHETHDPEGRRPFGLFDGSGRSMAGKLAAVPMRAPPLGRVFDFTLEQGGRKVPFRGLATALPNGTLLVLTQNVYEMEEFRELLVNAMAWGGILVLAVGLIGAGIIGLGSVRRINAITRAIERIVTGDLAKRLPTHKGAGDLDRLVNVVNGMLDDIERLMREVKGVTDDIAHDLRTPLTRLLAGMERARRRATSAEEYAAAVDEAIAETKDVLGTFSALLRIAEVEDGARRAGFTTIDLERIAADVTEFHAPVAEESGITLSLETEGSGPARMSGDSSLMFEAISNLVDNAIKFSPAGSRVTVRTFRSKEHFGVGVVDTGPGIPEHEREAVLRRFYRLEKSRHTPGSGLGLSLVAAVAKLHGLKLAIEPANPGCCVTLVREKPAESPQSQDSTLPGASESGQALRAG